MTKKKLDDNVRLPPDPDKQNDDRADWADAAIETFMAETRTDIDDVLCDLLADLGHWADRNGQNLAASLARASDHYYAETNGKGKQLRGTDVLMDKENEQGVAN